MTKRTLTVTMLLASVGSSASAAVIGPDAFGYVGSDDVPFVWEDISLTGASLGGGDDAYFHFTPGAGFSFDFYGVNHSSFSVATNGAAYFADSYLGLHNTEIPGPTVYDPQALMAVAWDDLVAGEILWELRGSAGDRRLVIQWNDTRVFGSQDDNQFQVVLHEADGTIDFNYMEITGLASSGLHTIGIQGDPTMGLQWAHNTPGTVSDGTTIRWQVVPAPSALALLGLAGLAGTRRRRS